MAGLLPILVALGVLAAALGACLLSRRRARRSRAALSGKTVMLDEALNNMTQGLNMFDAAGRLVVSNERYLAMYRLSPEAVRPGVTVTDLVKLRLEAGTFFKHTDPAQYIGELMSSITGRKPTRTTRELADGRVITVVNQPTVGGGWVVTHEDVTERARAERELEQTRNFLDTVIENVPATIVVKDVKTMRYILINRAGEEFHGLSRDQVIGKTAEEFFPPDVAAAIAMRDRELMRAPRQVLLRRTSGA